MGLYKFEDINGYPIEEGDKIAKVGQEDKVYIVEDITAKGMELDDETLVPWEDLKSQFKLLEKVVIDQYSQDNVYITLNEDMKYYTEWRLEENDDKIMLVSFKDGVAWERRHGIMQEGKLIVILGNDLQDGPYSYYSVVKEALGFK